jgi:hypothetical protein
MTHMIASTSESPSLYPSNHVDEMTSFQSPIVKDTLQVLYDVDDDDDDDADDGGVTSLDISVKLSLYNKPSSVAHDTLCTTMQEETVKCTSHTSVATTASDTTATTATTTTLDTQTVTASVTTNNVPNEMYGHPLSLEQVEALLPSSEGGLVWKATIVPKPFLINGKLRSGLRRSDFDIEQKCIKLRRPSLPLTAKDFLSSLTYVDHSDRIIFHGVLNGWPGLTTLEVMHVEQRRRTPVDLVLPSPMSAKVANGKLRWVTIWKQGSVVTTDSHDSTNTNSPLGLLSLDPAHTYRVTLRGAPSSCRAWSPTSPGHVFWYEALRTPAPRLTYGRTMLSHLSPTTMCTHIHMLSHRYALKRENVVDRFTYHSVCLLEWDHGEYCTVLQAGYLNSLGGSQGRSNWYHDKMEPVPELYQHLPPEMLSPWQTQQSEIACYDVPIASLEAFQEYIQHYTGPHKRFLDPRLSFSHPVRLSHCSQHHIAQYLLNYITHDRTYRLFGRSCQTFSADLCSFLTGKKVVPFQPISRVQYQNRTYMFSYNSDMYRRRSQMNINKQGKH